MSAIQDTVIDALQELALSGVYGFYVREYKETVLSASLSGNLKKPDAEDIEYEVEECYIDGKIYVRDYYDNIYDNETEDEVGKYDFVQMKWISQVVEESVDDIDVDVIDVDDFDSPNVYPYKACRICCERKSCGSYSESLGYTAWFCENCLDE